MTVRRMKSSEARRDFADALQFVRTGGRVIVEHYNHPIAMIVPYDENEDHHTEFPQNASVGATERPGKRP